MSLLVVLGGGLNSKNEISCMTSLRISKALELSSQYDNLLLSGGISYRNKNKSFIKPESQLMENYLLSNGVSSNKLSQEQDSFDTLSNAFFCRKILDELNISDFKVLTSDFHVDKSKYVFDLVFGSSNKNIGYIGVPDLDLYVGTLMDRRCLEDCVIDFYDEHLEKSYGVKSGDLDSISNFLFNFNPSFTGKFDKHHIKLGESISALKKVCDPKYDL